MNLETFVIFDKNNEFSCKLANDVFQACENYGYDAKPHQAYTGDLADDYIRDKQISISNDGDFSSNQGTRGCFASHHSLWELCYERNEPIIVLEHDGLPLREFTLNTDDVEHVCHLDAYTPFRGDIDPKNTSYTKEEYHKRVNRFLGNEVVRYPFNRFYGDVRTTGSCFMGAHGYYLKPEGAKRIIDFIREKGGRPADKAICEKSVNIQRSKTSFVRVHPFFDCLNKHREFSTRV